MPSYHLFARALTTTRRHVGSDPADDFVCFSSNANASNEDSINLVAQLHQQNGSLQNPYFLNEIISFCAKSALYDVGIQVHSLIVKVGFTSNPYLCTALVRMYGKCSEILSSQKLIDELPHRNVVAWNSLISGYLHVRLPEIAVSLFTKMLKEGIVPTAFSVSALLVA